MSLAETYRCARSLEAIENYALTADPIQQNIELCHNVTNGSSDELSPWHGDEFFWNSILKHPDEKWGQKCEFTHCALSEWVARVPGLYWSPGAKTLRDQGRTSPIVNYSNTGRTYHPYTKSMIVSGGVGTLKFPPDNAGNQLVTLSVDHNASSGAPAIISPEVWEYHKLGDGDVISGYAHWQKMTTGWAKQFSFTRGIPRGYLIISDPHQINVSERKTPTLFHPCTIMEYYKGDAVLYDFVYASADTSVESYRQKLEKFFNEYKDRDERYGRYLLAAEINAANPLWDANYTCPEDLYAIQGGKSQLFLLQERMRAHSFKDKTIDELIQALAHNFDNDDLQEISRDIGISPAHWFTHERATISAAQLLDMCVQRKKVEELVDALAYKNSAIFV